ncbi:MULTISPECIES: 4'-phosphopantetheinyl transferase superfamily protein [unclassified Streptomyces]|uniref:4'-phosphopantetheinyl transferase superfamily protein n=1 Tax=unclassified Streptomyces TaxID=2593676 RepID=UPI00363DD415
MSTGFDLQSVPELRAKRHLLTSRAVFTAAELAHCRSRPDPAASLTGLFSAKEACVKALSTLGGAPPYTFPEIEITYGPAGQPRLRPHGRLAGWWAERRLAAEISISHTGDLAGSVAVLLEDRGTGMGDTTTLPPPAPAPTPADEWDVTEHRAEIELRPNDFDWAGHLNNSVHPQLLETGRWQWALANDVDLRDSELVAVVLQLSLDYVKSVEWNPVGKVAVRTSLAERSAYSFTLAQDIEELDGTVVARGRVRLGLVERGTQRIHRADLAALRRTPGRAG